MLSRLREERILAGTGEEREQLAHAWQCPAHLPAHPPALLRGAHQPAAWPPACSFAHQTACQAACPSFACWSTNVAAHYHFAMAATIIEQPTLMQRSLFAGFW